jgi:hypothetical protein
MHFLQWLRQYKWDAYGWLAIILIGGYWETMGALRHDRTTFTDLVRNTIPIDFRLIILCVLIWHFCVSKGNR